MLLEELVCEARRALKKQLNKGATPDLSVYEPLVSKGRKLSLKLISKPNSRQLYGVQIYASNGVVSQLVDQFYLNTCFSSEYAETLNHVNKGYMFQMGLSPLQMANEQFYAKAKETYWSKYNTLDLSQYAQVIPDAQKLECTPIWREGNSELIGIKVTGIDMQNKANRYASMYFNYADKDVYGEYMTHEEREEYLRTVYKPDDDYIRSLVLPKEFRFIGDAGMPLCTPIPGGLVVEHSYVKDQIVQRYFEYYILNK